MRAADRRGLDSVVSRRCGPTARRRRRTTLATANGKQAQRAFAGAPPHSHQVFLARLELMAIYGDYAFVHAGIRADAPLDAQSERDLLWIREEFLEVTDGFEKVIVHGHTPVVEPFLGADRISVDTGAYATGVLSAVRLMGTGRRIIQARQ